MTNTINPASAGAITLTVNHMGCRRRVVFVGQERARITLYQDLGVRGETQVLYSTPDGYWLVYSLTWRCLKGEHNRTNLDRALWQDLALGGRFAELGHVAGYHSLSIGEEPLDLNEPLPIGQAVDPNYVGESLPDYYQDVRPLPLPASVQAELTPGKGVAADRGGL